MSEYMGPTYLLLDTLMLSQDITAKEQRSICSNSNKESNPATPRFSKDSRFELIDFPPFVKRPLLRDCSNQISTKKEMNPDE